MSFLLKLVGINLLTTEQTEVYLKPHNLLVLPENRVALPDIKNIAFPGKSIFSHAEAITHHAYVWSCENTQKQSMQLAYGGIVMNNRVLCTNFDSHHVIRNFAHWRTREKLTKKVVIAPWSHYLDGVSFGGYYDFVILVAAKLCRIKDALPPEIFNQAAVSYPLFNTVYERELLALIGIDEDHIFDSRLTDISFDQCVLSNSGHWFYPNVADIISLKKYIETNLKPRKTAQNRIYISRSGRRHILNEEALITLLKKYDFQIIDDKPRSIAEQVEIYKNASFIMGPHGASFTNIIWCEPGTHLFELFSQNYVVDHFLYVSQVMNMTYSAYHHGVLMEKNHRAIGENIFVSIADIQQYLDQVFDPMPKKQD